MRVERPGRRPDTADRTPPSRPDPRRALGQQAEATAAAFLEGLGFRIVGRNVRLPEGELDLVCRDGDVWVFVEVKCRDARWGDDPGAAVSWRKQRRLTRLAQHYLKWKARRDARCRFDVVAVVVVPDGAPQIRHLRAAFDALE